MTAPHCALEGERGRPAERGLLCAEHARALGRMLDPDERDWTPATDGGPVAAPSIPVLFAGLDPLPVVAERVVGSAFGPRDPGRLDVIALGDLRSAPDADGQGSYSVLGVLGALVVQLGGPSLQSVWGAAAWLTDHLDAMCGSEGVREAFSALSTLHATLRRVSGDPGPRFVTFCTQPVSGSLQCGTAIYGPERAVRGDDERAPSIAAIRCSGCGHHWSALELRSLVRARKGAA